MSSMNDLKMMYSLRWKHDPKREASSFVFVYDIPNITMNFQVFKNYLLKNSGNPVEDICVSYIKHNGKEYPINTQADFQLALYTFRRSALEGNVINLLLERVSDSDQYKTLLQNDMQTQSDTPQDNFSDFGSDTEIPEWFETAMKQMKSELSDNILAQMNQVTYNYLMSEVEAVLVLDEDLDQMDARPVNLQTSLPHMLGGEVYLHQWEVKNTGKIPWDFWTDLQFTWGSKKLVPVEMRVPVPSLKPGEQGVISVCLRIPPQSGQYECYWQFMHKGHRFGQSLGVQVIVDGLNWNGSPKSNSNFEPKLDQNFHFPSDDNKKTNVPMTQLVTETPAEKETTEAKPTETPAEKETTEAKPTETSQNNSIKLENEELDNILVITVPKDEQAKKGFIYIFVDGQKVLVPKNILKSEVVTAAEKLELDALKSEGVNANSTPNDSSQPTSLVTATPTPESSVQEPFIPQQAVDLTTSPRDRKKHNDTSCSLAESDFSEVQTLKPHQINISQTTTKTKRKKNKKLIDPLTSRPRQQNMQALAAMGFWNYDLNSRLLDRYNDDINQTVAELLR